MDKNTARIARYLQCAAIAGLAWIGCAQAESMTFVMQSFPPFVVDQKGHAEGPFPDVVRAVCASINISCKQQVYPWRRALRMAEEGDADGILVIQKLPEREKAFYLSEPIVRTSYAVFVHQNSTLSYSAPMDLEAYTVGVYGPSATSQAAEEIAKSAPAMSLVMEVSNLTVLRKLSALRYGERSAAVMNLDVGNYLLKQENIADIKVAGEIKKIEYFIGLSRKKVSGKQAEQFHAALHELTRNGTIKAIIEKYGMKPAASQGASAK